MYNESLQGKVHFSLREPACYREGKCHKSFQKALEPRQSVGSRQSYERIGLHSSARYIWPWKPAVSLTSSLLWILQMGKGISKMNDEIGIGWGSLGITYWLAHPGTGKPRQSHSSYQMAMGLGIKVRRMAEALNGNSGARIQTHHQGEWGVKYWSG